MCLFLYSVPKVLKAKNVYAHTIYTSNSIKFRKHLLHCINAWHVSKCIVCTENIVTTEKNIF